MNIFFSGIGGVGLGPLAEIAKEAGHTVYGTDPTESLMTKQLRGDGVRIESAQDGSFLSELAATDPVDWLVYTAAMPFDHPELTVARELGIKITKRDELLAEIIERAGMELIAVSGTHGKTTTTGMLVWAFKQLGIPVSYSIGTTISFGKSGEFNPSSEYFVYECDEFDRNFLHFSPYLSLVTSLGYDHSDTYKTKTDYFEAFGTFLNQSAHGIGWQDDLGRISNLPEPALWQLNHDEVFDLKLAGAHNRRNATLVLKALEYLDLPADSALIESFPGTNRRFEKLADNLYSDYGHHPTEIAATLQMARELNDQVVLVYQPHQNIRQHEIRNLYKDCFKDAEHIYWLPTYLSREDPDLPILSPQDLTADITNNASITIAEIDDSLWHNIETAKQSGKLVLCMGAGSIDGWVRSNLG